MAAMALKSFLSAQRLRELTRRGFDVRELPRWTSKIIYSSYFENLSPVLGYKGRIRDKVEHKKELIEECVKGSLLTNIPVSLQLVAPDLNSAELLTGRGGSADIKATLDTDLDNTQHRLQFPYRQYHNILSEQKPEAGKKRRLRPQLEKHSTTDDPNESTDWFHDYGTPDSAIPPTNIPCGGCGALLHCQDTAIPGYLPSERIKMMNNEELRAELCQRCYFFSHHNTALKVNISPGEYPKILSQITDKPALVILLVDLLDFPCSLWPGIVDIIGKRRPVMLVGNKVDLLPRDSSTYLRHLKMCLETTAREVALRDVNLVHTALISATTGFGVEPLIDKIFSEWGFKGDIYLLGCTNVGKSSLFNAFLQSDLCKVQVVDLIQRATISPWPGTTLNLLKFPVTRPEAWRVSVRRKRLVEDQRTLAEVEGRRENLLRETRNPVYATLVGHIGRSFEDPSKQKAVEQAERVSDIFKVNPFGKTPGLVAPKKGEWDERDPQFVPGKWCFDTPGAVADNQILDQLTLKELMLTLPKEIIIPRTYLLHPEMSLFVGGLARMDYKDSSLDQGEGRPIRLIVFTSQYLPINVVRTEDAEEVYQEGLGSPIFGIPFGDAERLKEFPPLKGKIFRVTGIGGRLCAADLVISSTGWIGLNIRNGQEVTLEVFTPNGKGIFCRSPSFLPNVPTLKGKKLRSSLSYSAPKPYLGPLKRLAQ